LERKGSIGLPASGGVFRGKKKGSSPGEGLSSGEETLILGGLWDEKRVNTWESVVFLSLPLRTKKKGFWGESPPKGEKIERSVR